MKSPWYYLTKLDQMIIVGLALLGALGFVWAMSAPQGRRLVVTDGTKLIYLGNLDQKRSITLQGPLGKTVLMIDQSGVRITSSPCPLKICMGMGPAKYEGDFLACVPNRILVEIEDGSPEESHYDILSR